MTFEEYSQQANRTLPDMPEDDALAMLAMGLAGESGEAIDVLKKYLFHGHPLDLQKIENELGDVLWYLAGLVHVLGFDFDMIAQANITKLRKRYPNGFNHADSVNRTN